MPTFSYTGGVQTYVVPSGVSIVKIECAGAQGSPDRGAPLPRQGSRGAVISSYHTVTPGETLRIYVGGSGTNGGYNGGGSSNHSTGGGGTDVRRGGTALSNRIIAAGGGGGEGNGNNIGGNGGYPTGGGGNGGTQTSGGSPGGALGVGGAGRVSGSIHGGGGGGGWYGGGGGTAQTSPFIVQGGGGGGSSRTLGTLISAQSSAQANRAGNGYATIEPYVTPTPTLSTPAANATIQSRTINVSGSVAAAHPLSGGKVRLGFQLLHATDDVQIQYVESADTTGAGSAQFTSVPNGTYRVRARTVGTNGLPNSAWTALRTITVDHRPTVQSVLPTSAPESNGVTLGQSFRLKGIDPDPSDTIKRYRVQVRAGTTVVADTGSVTLASPAASGATFDAPVAIGAEHLGNVLNWRACVRDEDDSADGVWSSWSNFVFAEVPSVLINSPEDSGTATSGAPALSATYTLPAVEGQARRAAAVQFTVRDVSTGNVAYQYTFENRPASAPGLPVTETLEITPPQPVLENDREYILTVRTTDQFGIFSEADSMFLVQYESPDPIDYSVDASQSSSAGFVRVDWSDSAVPITRINLLPHPIPDNASWSGSGAGAAFSLLTSGGPLPESPSVYRASVGTTGIEEKYIYTSPAGLGSIPVAPGLRYNFSAYVMMKGPGATTPTVRLRALWYDETGVQISPSDGVPLPAAEGDQWIRRSENFTAPAAARFVRLAVVMGGTQPAGVGVDVSAAQITEGPALHPYFNGNSPELPGQATYSWEGAENGSRSIAEVSRIDGEFQAFRVYRRYLPSGDWKLIFETDDNLVMQYDDWLFEPGIMVQYNVTQIGTRFGTPIESPLGYRMTLTGAEVETRSYTPLSDRYWIICLEDPSLTVALSASEAPETEEYESESYGLIGRGRHRDYGTRWGYVGSLTVKIREHDNRSETRLAVERLRMEQRTYYLRTPFGRVHPVAIGDLSWTPLAGVGNAEMGDLVIPYEEVAL